MITGLHAISDVCADSIFALRDVKESQAEKELAKHIWNMVNSEKYDILMQNDVVSRQDINAAIIEKPVKELVTFFFDGMKITLEVIEELGEDRDKDFKRMERELKKAKDDSQEKDEKADEMRRRLKAAERELNRLKQKDYDRRERSNTRSRSRSRGRSRRR